MRRKIFFWLDRLEITRAERIAVMSLLISLMILTAVHAWQSPAVVYDEIYYAELEQIFNERSKGIDQERQAILARYEPAVTGEVQAETELSAVEPEIWGGKININTADEEELQELPGIGPAYAERIIAWREENGRFTSAEQLLEIRGIGEARLSRIEPLITLDDESG